MTSPPAADPGTLDDPSTPSRPAGAHSLWRLRSYLRPHYKALALMGVTAFLGVFVALSIPLVTKAMIDGPIADHEVAPILPLGILALLLGLAEAGLILIRRWVQARAVLGFETALRDDLYRHMQELPMEFHSRWQSGQLLSRVTTDLSALRRFMGFGLLFLVINIIQLVFVTLLLLKLFWPLGIVVALSAVPIIALSKRFESRYVVVSRRVQDQQGDVATAVEEAAVGFRVIKSFGRRRFSQANFHDKTQTLYETSMEKVRLSSRFWTFLEVIPNISLVIVLLLGALGVGNDQLTLGTLVAFITLMLQLIWPIESLGVILAMAQEAMTAADRVLDIFDTRSSIEGGDVDLERASGHLRFEHVDFHYPDSAELVLADVTLDVHPGETVAIVGATGSGKTSLTALVPRLYDATAGRVTIDGVDTRDLTLPSLRRIVATAFEDATLFSMSVRENVTLGRPDASDDDIRDAIETAQAGFVYELPWGLETRIGEQGMSLSGGQRQRLALARAVLARPKILVLDDTLSALDVHTEALVEQALRRVLADTTAILVAHRASTVMLADRVALLSGKTITHVGSHHDLLATVPAYRELLAGEQDVEGDLDTRRTGATAR
ncbi:MAG: ABC transporter ATP-binding protein [Nocardioidaceae bacterium]